MDKLRFECISSALSSGMTSYDLAAYYPMSAGSMISGGFSVGTINDGVFMGEVPLMRCRDKFLKRMYEIATSTRPTPFVYIILTLKDSGVLLQDFSNSDYWRAKNQGIVHIDIKINGNYVACPCILFKFPLTEYVAPTHFWCATESLRKKLTGISLLPREEHPYSSSEFGFLETALSNRLNYNEKIPHTVGINVLNYCQPRYLFDARIALRVEVLSAFKGSALTEWKFNEYNPRLFTSNRSHSHVINEIADMLHVVEGIREGKYVINWK